MVAEQPRSPDFRLIVRVYLTMAAGGLVLALFATGGVHFPPFGFPGERPLFFLFAAAGAAVLTHCASRFALRFSARTRRCADHIRALLGGLGRREVFWVAVCSGIGEELLFRGWLLNATNLEISSLLFGLVHFPPNRDWLLWPVFAAIMGLLLGALCLLSGTLLWAVLLHAAINYLNLRHILFAETPPRAEAGGGAPPTDLPRDPGGKQNVLDFENPRQ